MFLILNNHSCSFEGDESQARSILETVVNAFTHVIKISEGKITNNLQTTQNFATIMLNSSYGFSVWRNQNIDRELKRKFLSICERQQIIDEEINDEMEVRYADYSDGALQIAYTKDYALLSFGTNESWKCDEIDVSINYIDESVEQHCCLKNFYNEGSIGNNSWIKTLPSFVFTEKYADINSLLNDLDNAFPNLIFHDMALKQLKNEIQSSWYHSLANRLYELDQSCLGIEDNDFDKRFFPPRTISSESKETINRFKKEYTFEYKGQSYLIKYHLRYTGNSQGRIYFVPIEGKKCIVYSLTTKLPTVSYPKFKI